MDDQQRARELLAAEHQPHGRTRREILTGEATSVHSDRAIRAITAALRAAPDAVALRTAMETLEQIATAPDDKGAKFNAASCVAFLTTQGAGAPKGFVPVPVEPTEQQVAAGIEQVQAVLDALGPDASAQTLALVAYDGMLAARAQGVK